jgi:UDP-N-acetylmuramate dehydrogenase
MHPEYLILSAEFELRQGDRGEIKNTMAELARRRRASQPLDKPSAGSTFKRPEGYFAGKLIEDCSLKGFAIGGAQVSSKHAGFVINTCGATCSDVLALCEHIQKTVYERFGVTLEREIKILGEE